MITEQAHIIVFTPHPDDAESRMAGTVARWVCEGKNIVYVVCTNGDKGTNAPNMKPEELARIRERAVGSSPLRTLISITRRSSVIRPLTHCGISSSHGLGNEIVG